MRTKLLYIQGPPRSGTTFLHSWVASSPEIIGLGEFDIHRALGGSAMRAAIDEIFGLLRASVQGAATGENVGLNEIWENYIAGSTSDNVGLALVERVY